MKLRSATRIESWTTLQNINCCFSSAELSDQTEKTENCLNIEFNSQFQWVTFHSTRRGVVFLFYFISRPVKVELEPKLFFQTESRRLLPTHFLWNFMHTSKLSSFALTLQLGKFTSIDLDENYAAWFQIEPLFCFQLIGVWLSGQLGFLVAKKHFFDTK